MIDHVGFPVSDYARSKAFYEKALAPLGYTLIMEVQQNEHDAKAAGFGANGKPDFWIGGEGGLNSAMHIAIAAKDRAAVDAFYKAALAAGAQGQRRARHPRALSSELLRRLRARSRRAQHRGGVPRAGVSRSLRSSPRKRGSSSSRLGGLGPGFPLARESSGGQFYAGRSIFACTSSIAVAKP